MGARGTASLATLFFLVVVVRLCRTTTTRNNHLGRLRLPKLLLGKDFASALQEKVPHLQSRPIHGTIASVGYDSVAQWIRALPCGGRGRAFESPQGHHRSEGRSRSIASGRPSERPTAWGGDRAVECARLENELGVKAYVGSNPTLPASRLRPIRFVVSRYESNFESGAAFS